MQLQDHEGFIQFVRETFDNKDTFIPLHAPVFKGNEKKYINECIDSTFVSSVGKFVDQFEDKMKAVTGAKYAIATVNGTAALHIALHALGVSSGDEVITQPLTFVATCNAIRYTGANPLFIDVDIDTMGLSPSKLKSFLGDNCELKEGYCINKITGNIIKACVPMHTFGFPCRIEELVQICDEWNIELVEDAAESLGSYVGKKHTGTFGKLGTFSFNGNKVITAGGGGCVVTNDEKLALKLKHITTTAKEPHKWEYTHLELGFNYRMPNINAALVCAQLEQLPLFSQKKRKLAETYSSFFETENIDFKWEREGTIANFWLNTILLKNKEERDSFLTITNNNKVMTRPAWNLMNTLPMFEDCVKGELENSYNLVDRIVNIPSSVII